MCYVLISIKESKMYLVQLLYKIDGIWITRDQNGSQAIKMNQKISKGIRKDKEYQIRYFKVPMLKCVLTLIDKSASVNTLKLQ